jgi:hypothetical protein
MEVPREGRGSGRLGESLGGKCEVQSFSPAFLRVARGSGAEIWRDIKRKRRLAANSARVAGGCALCDTLGWGRVLLFFSFSRFSPTLFFHAFHRPGRERGAMETMEEEKNRKLQYNNKQTLCARMFFVPLVHVEGLHSTRTPQMTYRVRQHTARARRARTRHSWANEKNVSGLKHLFW